MQEILNYYPYLKVVNIKNLTTRLLEVTQGDMFIAYNKQRDTYELHSILSFKLNRHSCQGILEPDMLNGHMLKMVRANSIKKYGQEIKDRRSYLDQLHDNADAKVSGYVYEQGRKAIRNTLGRDL